MVNIVDNNGQYKLTIPKNIIESKKWSAKTKLRFIDDLNGNILLKALTESGIKIVNNAGQYKITIPIDIVDDKGWSSKTKIRFVEDIQGNIILKEIEGK